MVRLRITVFDPDRPCLRQENNQRYCNSPNKGIWRKFCSCGSSEVKIFSLSLSISPGMDDKTNTITMSTTGGQKFVKYLCFTLDTSPTAALIFLSVQMAFYATFLFYVYTSGLTDLSLAFLRHLIIDTDRLKVRAQNPNVF